jgi:hypothetical protein
MDAKHTPGPWRCENMAIYGANGHVVCRIVEPTGHGRSGEPSSYGPQAPHDARLIAAAPDLLAALRWAMAVLDGYDPPMDAEPAKRYADGLLTARAAIDRAEGGAGL